jgi:hypothetical protein
MTNVEISALRKIAGDLRIPVQSRLHAIDEIAAYGGLYLVEETLHDGKTRWQTVGLVTEYLPAGVRARRCVISLLRKLPPSSRRDDRLLFLRSPILYERGRVNRRERLYSLKPPSELQPPAKSIADDEIVAALAKWRANNGNGESSPTADEKQATGCSQ